MPFCDAVELFEYWADYPPAHILLRAYVGYEGNIVSPMEQAAAMHALTGGARAAKLETASPVDRARFAALKEQVKNGR